MTGHAVGGQQCLDIRLSDPRWTSVTKLLGRSPTRIEEELAIHLICTGHLHLVEQVVLDRTPFTCPIGALTPVADLILSKWNAMERTHQDAVRSELQGLLWRIRGSEVSDPGSYRTLAQDVDMEVILRGITLASRVWGQLGREQRAEVREALRRFRKSAADTPGARKIKRGYAFDLTGRAADPPARL